jgi:hypothetical protein
MFIPYPWLSESPKEVLVFGDIPVYLCLSERNGRHCLITLSDSHRFHDTQAISVPVGTAFEIEYRGTVCEIQLGRRLVLCDAT